MDGIAGAVPARELVARWKQDFPTPPIPYSGYIFERRALLSMDFKQRA